MSKVTGGVLPVAARTLLQEAARVDKQRGTRDQRSGLTVIDKLTLALRDIYPEAFMEETQA